MIHGIGMPSRRYVLAALSYTPIVCSAQSDEEYLSFLVKHGDDWPKITGANVIARNAKYRRARTLCERISRFAKSLPMPLSSHHRSLFVDLARMLRSRRGFANIALMDLALRVALYSDIREVSMAFAGNRRIAREPATRIVDRTLLLELIREEHPSKDDYELLSARPEAGLLAATLLQIDSSGQGHLRAIREGYRIASILDSRNLAGLLNRLAVTASAHYTLIPAAIEFMNAGGEDVDLGSDATRFHELLGDAEPRLIDPIIGDTILAVRYVLRYVSNPQEVDDNGPWLE